jgi:hypothetical protein
MIAALDIGKNTHYAYFRSPNGKDIKPFPFGNFSRDWGRRLKDESFNIFTF